MDRLILIGGILSYGVHESQGFACFRHGTVPVHRPTHVGKYDDPVLLDVKNKDKAPSDLSNPLGMNLVADIQRREPRVDIHRRYPERIDSAIMLHALIDGEVPDAPP